MAFMPKLYRWTLIIGLLGLVWPTALNAADYTDVLDAADDMSDNKESTYDPFDIEFRPEFSFSQSKSSISREAPCVPSKSEYGPANNPSRPAVFNNQRLVVDPSRCSEPQVIYKKEMMYQNTRNQLDFNLEAGLYKDLELHLSVPFVFSSTHALKYSNGASNSQVDPTTNQIRNETEETFNQNNDYETTLRRFDTFSGYSFFDLQNQYTGYTRSGLADPSIGLNWAPYNDQRDPTKATLVLGAAYTMPFAPTKKVDNNAVGKGLHRFDFNLKASKKFGHVDPYFGLAYSLPFASSGSPIAEKPDAQNQGQVFSSPPQKADITVGSEFIFSEDKEAGTKYAVDLRFFFGYTSMGRTYTPLFDHMGNSRCNGKTASDVLPQFGQNGSLQNPTDVSCAWIIQKPANFEGDQYAYDLSTLSNQARQNTPFRTNGIMNQDSYGEFGGRLGLQIQPLEKLRFEALAEFSHRQSYLISNARLGKDLPDSRENNPDNAVDLQTSDQERQNNTTPTDVERERNPFHNTTYDSPGKRFRLDGLNTWSFILNASLRF